MKTLNEFDFPKIAYSLTAASLPKKMILCKTFPELLDGGYAIYYSQSGKFPERVYKNQFKNGEYFMTELQAREHLLDFYEKKVVRMKEKIKELKEKQSESKKTPPPTFTDCF